MIGSNEPFQKRLFIFKALLFPNGRVLVGKGHGLVLSDVAQLIDNYIVRFQNGLLQVCVGWRGAAR